MKRTEAEVHSGDRLDFVVGSEIRLKNIIALTDLRRLFEACMSAGASGAAVLDDQGRVLAEAGGITDGKGKAGLQRRDLFYEGERVGSFCCLFPEYPEGKTAQVTEIAAACIQMIIENTAKRMLATELHTTVVNQSYDELMETNRKLRISEQQYRNLAQSLELKVDERTAELKAAHARMLQQEKMASIGQLAAGMAHEINNPVGFIASNLNSFGGYMQRIREALLRCREICQETGDSGAQADALFKRLRIGYVLDDIPELLRQCGEGVERVKAIVANLKGFSHIDDAGEDYVDINQELDRTVSVLEHDCRGRVAFVRKYGQLPGYLCNPGLICQVFLNIIQNSLQATERPLQIRLATAATPEAITVVIEDNGPGIPGDIIGRIFEPFFTTKDVGKGTGLGLSVAYDIVRNHGGEITAGGTAGGGTAITLRLPLKGRSHG